MNNVELLYQTSVGNVAYNEISLTEFEQTKFSLVENAKAQQGTVKAFLGGDKLIFKFPEQLMPRQNDKLLTVILDSGDKKQGFDMYESEFQIIAESWRKKKWGFSATDIFGNMIARQEYDYVSGLNEMGIKMYADNRRVYSIENELEFKKKKGALTEMFQGIKKDADRLFGFFKK